MSKQNNGGQAFPCLERGGSGLDLTDGGMSLRDYFAAKAMQAEMANPEWHSGEGPDWANGVAIVAYKMADAMLKAREAT